MERFLSNSNQSRFLQTAARLVLVAATVLIVIGISSVPPADAAVTITSFGARFQNNQVLVTWITATELNNLGFNILRSTTSSGTYAKIAGVIPSQSPGSVTGGLYSYTDSNVTVGQTYYYKLQALERGGGTQQFGPVSTDPSAGIPSATPTRTNTAIPPSRTPTPTVAATLTSTIAPTATATPSVTGTLIPTLTGTPATPVLTLTGTPPATLVLTVTGTPPARVAIASTPASGKPPSGKVPAATPQGVATAPAEAPQVAPLPSPAADALEASSDEVAPEDQATDQNAANPNLRLFVGVFFYGLAGVFGLGSLVFGVLAVVLFTRAISRR
jgi:hypothetical protein